MLSSNTPPDPQRAELIWQRLAKFCLLYSIGWVVALAYYSLVASVFHYVWPRSTFLFAPNDRYGDFVVTWLQAKAPNPYINPGTRTFSTYFPFPYAVLRVAKGFTLPSLLFTYFAVTFGSVLLIWIWWLREQRALWKGDSRWPIVITLTFFIVVCNYPMLFAVDRGNLDPLAMCLTYAAIQLVSRRRKVVGGLLLAVASASKGFPFAAVLYWIRRRQILAVAVAVSVFAASILVSAATFKGGVAVTLHAFSENLRLFRQRYVLGDLSAYYSTDWLNALRVLARWLQAPRLDMVRTVQWYERLATLIMLAYPNVANDYKLIMLLPPILEWLVSTAKGWRDSVFCVTAALLMLPKHFYFPRQGDAASISCIISPMLLLAMSLVLWPTSTEIAKFRESYREMRGRIRAFGFKGGRQ
jgi:hypothetical protein